MPTGERTARPDREAQRAALTAAWRRLGRAASVVALLTAPAAFVLFRVAYDWPLLWSLLATAGLVVSFRGFIDVVAHRLIPRASLYGAGRELKEADIVAQRRGWGWGPRVRPPARTAPLLGTVAGPIFPLCRGGGTLFGPPPPPPRCPLPV